MGASKVFPLALKGPVLTRRRNRTLEARLHRNLLSKRVLSLIPCLCFIGILVCATKFFERFLCYCHNMPICGAVLGDLLLFFSKLVRSTTRKHFSSSCSYRAVSQVSASGPFNSEGSSYLVSLLKLHRLQKERQRHRTKKVSYSGKSSLAARKTRL